MSKTVRILTVGEEQIPYELERGRVKRLNLRVRRDGTVHLSVPLTTPEAFVERFLQEKGAWLVEARTRMLATRQATDLLADGAPLLMAGEQYTVRVQTGERGRCECREGELILTVRDPSSTDERVLLLRRLAKARAAAYLTDRIKAFWPHFSPRPATFPTLTFRWLRSRWGSCTASKNHITLNEKLLFVPPHLADYVILHELCHFAYQDHSKAFYRHLSQYYPDYARARKELRAARIPE